MALLDEKRDAFVVRIVYDGPPFSGKTTTLRKLSQGLSRTVETPEEHDGRTLFFDWLDYTAGRFEGRPIRCQVVSVPGQRSLAERRRRLLKEADSVVFVADTGALGMDLSLKYARELASTLAAIGAPTPGVVVQANKRDVDDALPIPEVLGRFRAIGLETGIIETTATSGAGVREAFLFGVRLALDRVRELSARGLLRSGKPMIDSSEDLLRSLREQPPSSSSLRLASSEVTAANDRVAGRGEAGGEPQGTTVDALVREALTAEQGMRLAVRAAPEGAGPLPDPSVASGFIWPPIEGRIVVQQALASGEISHAQRSSDGYHFQSSNGWELNSRAQDVFDDQNAARAALIEWARLHVRNQPLLTERRCIVLSPDGERWRLWQVVGNARSLDDFLAQELGGTSIRQAAEALLVVASKLTAAVAQFDRATVRLVFGLHTVSVDSSDTKYVGLMPGPEAERDAGSESRDMSSVVIERMRGYVQRYAEHFGRDRLLAEFDSIIQSAPEKRAIAELLCDATRSSEVA